MSMLIEVDEHVGKDHMSAEPYRSEELETELAEASSSPLRGQSIFAKLQYTPSPNEEKEEEQSVCTFDQREGLGVSPLRDEDETPPGTRKRSNSDYVDRRENPFIKPSRTSPKKKGRGTTNDDYVMTEQQLAEADQVTKAWMLYQRVECHRFANGSGWRWRCKQAHGGSERIRERGGVETAKGDRSMEIRLIHHAVEALDHRNLWDIAANGNWELHVEEATLCQACQEQLEDSGGNMTTPIIKAVRAPRVHSLYKRQQMVRFLVDKGRSSLDGALVFAGWNCEPEFILWLLDAYHIDVNGRVPMDQRGVDGTGNGETVLHAALFTGKDELVKTLITDHKGDVNSRYEDDIYCGETLLHVACVQGNLDMVRFLVERGAYLEAKVCPHAKFFQCTKSSSSTSSGSSTSRATTTTSSSNNRRKGCDCRLDSGLHAANDLYRWLLPPPLFEPYNEIYSGQTPLTFSAGNGHVHVTKYLLDMGANICQVDSECNSVFHILAIRQGRPAFERKQILHALEEHVTTTMNIELNTLLEEPNKEGYSALALSARQGDRDFCQAMINFSRKELWKFGTVVSHSYPLEAIDGWAAKIMADAHRAEIERMDGESKLTFSQKARQSIKRRKMQKSQDLTRRVRRAMEGKSVVDVIVRHKHVSLMDIPIVEHLVERKWEIFGQHAHYRNTAFYIVMLGCLCLSAALRPPLLQDRLSYDLPRGYGVGFFVPLFILGAVGFVLLFLTDSKNHRSSVNGHARSIVDEDEGKQRMQGQENHQLYRYWYRAAVAALALAMMITAVVDLAQGRPATGRELLRIMFEAASISFAVYYCKNEIEELMELYELRVSMRRYQGERSAGGISRRNSIGGALAMTQLFEKECKRLGLAKDMSFKDAEEGTYWTGSSVNTAADAISISNGHAGSNSSSKNRNEVKPSKDSKLSNESESGVSLHSQLPMLRDAIWDYFAGTKGWPISVNIYWLSMFGTCVARLAQSPYEDLFLSAAFLGSWVYSLVLLTPTVMIGPLIGMMWRIIRKNLVQFGTVFFVFAFGFGFAFMVLFQDFIARKAADDGKDTSEHLYSYHGRAVISMWRLALADVETIDEFANDEPFSWYYQLLWVASLLILGVLLLNMLIALMSFEVNEVYNQMELHARFDRLKIATEEEGRSKTLADEAEMRRRYKQEFFAHDKFPMITTTRNMVEDDQSSIKKQVTLEHVEEIVETQAIVTKALESKVNTLESKVDKVLAILGARPQGGASQRAA